eukprot:scaffold24634_cov63-Phaeocystis_antarctica.AAC.3
MQTNSIPTSAPGDRAPTYEEPTLIKMTNQQTKLGQAAPVRTMATAHSPLEPRAREVPRAVPTALWPPRVPFPRQTT